MVATQMPLAAPAVALAVGIRARGIGNIMHDAQHATVSSIPRLNAIVGNLAACATNNSFKAYDDEHGPHHSYTGSEGDPKLASYVEKGFTDVATPWSRERVAREILRASACAVRDSVLGFARRKGEVREIRGRTNDDRETATGQAVRLATWLGGATAGLLVGRPVPVATYLAATLVVKPVINTFTDVFNHAGLIPFETDPVRQTRGFTGGVIARTLFGAYRDDFFHYVHHFCTKIPWRNKEKAAALILERFKRADEIPRCDGIYFARHSDLPSVCEDIANRLQARHVLCVASGQADTDPN
jgi:fatty acid desaturase